MATAKPYQIQNTPDSLSRSECVAIAMKNNPRILYWNSKIDEAAAERNRAAGQRWPDITGTGSYSRYSETERMAPPREPGYPMVYADEVLSWNIQASVPIFTGWRISSELGAYEFLKDSARNRLEFTRRRIEYEVTELYFIILKQSMVIQSFEFSHRTLGEHLKKIKSLIAAEKASRSDLLRVEVRLADIAQRMEMEKGDLAVHKRGLLNLMGIDREDITIRQSLNLYPDYQAPDFDEALSSAYSKRADYLAAQKQLEAQEKRVDAARSAYWPTVSLFASYSGQRAAGSFIEMPGAAYLEDIARAGCVLELPIFEGGRRGAEVDIEKAKLAGQENRLRDLELQIRIEVESAVYHLESSKKRLAATDKAVDKAFESLRIEREKYELGKGAVTDVLDAESALQKMRAARYSALADYNIQIARIRFKTGENHGSHQ
ncbi:MAG: TolC family protein [Candidatus Krumholzibacteriales bacterium]